MPLPRKYKLSVKNNTAESATVTVIGQKWSLDTNGAPQWSGEVVFFNAVTVGAGAESTVDVDNSVDLAIAITDGLFDVDIASGTPSGLVELVLKTQNDAGTNESDHVLSFPLASVNFETALGQFKSVFRFD